MVMEVVAKAVKERIAVVILRVARLAKDVEAVAIEVRAEKAVQRVQRTVGRIIHPMPIGRKSMRHWRIAIPVIDRSRWEPVRPVSFPRDATACVREIPSPLIHAVGN